MSQVHQLPIGFLLVNQYKIIETIGQGGFGITYKALDTATERQVAIKEFFPNQMVQRNTETFRVYPTRGDQDYHSSLDKFKQEAQALARFDHDSIAKIYNTFEANGTAYIVMKFYVGKTLQDWLKSEEIPITENRAYSIMKPIFGALRQMHGDDTKDITNQRFIHRDIKPSNIILEKKHDGFQTVLLDFGGARQFIADESKSYSQTVSEGYAPKEQYGRRVKQGPYTDIYACGAVLYRMITGQRPPLSLDRQIIGQSSEDPGNFETDLDFSQFSPAFADVIAKAMAVEPNQRYQNMDDFVNALENARIMTMPKNIRQTMVPASQLVGHLNIGVEGKPNKSHIGFHLVGPKGFRHFFKESLNLQNLEQGTYRIEAEISDNHSSVFKEETFDIEFGETSEQSVHYVKPKTSWLPLAAIAAACFLVLTIGIFRVYNTIQNTTPETAKVPNENPPDTLGGQEDLPAEQSNQNIPESENKVDNTEIDKLKSVAEPTTLDQNSPTIPLSSENDLEEQVQETLDTQIPSEQLEQSQSEVPTSETLNTDDDFDAELSGETESSSTPNNPLREGVLGLLERNTLVLEDEVNRMTDLQKDIDQMLAQSLQIQNEVEQEFTALKDNTFDRNSGRSFWRPEDERAVENVNFKFTQIKNEHSVAIETKEAFDAKDDIQEKVTLRETAETQQADISVLLTELESMRSSASNSFTTSLESFESQKANRTSSNSTSNSSSITPTPVTQERFFRLILGQCYAADYEKEACQTIKQKVSTFGYGISEPDDGEKIAFLIGPFPESQIKSIQDDIFQKHGIRPAVVP